MQPISNSRREFLKTAGVLAMAAGIGVRRADAQQVPYSTGTEPPKLLVLFAIVTASAYSREAQKQRQVFSREKPRQQLVGCYLFNIASFGCPYATVAISQRDWPKAGGNPLVRNPMQRNGINCIICGRTPLEMSDRDFDLQATVGGLLSALRGTNESMSHK